MTTHFHFLSIFDLMATKFASRTSSTARFTGFWKNGRARKRLTAVYADLLQADDYRLADLGVTRQDLLRLLAALNKK